jgi:hypothetical protein
MSTYDWLNSREWAGFRVAFCLAFVRNPDPGAVLAMAGGVRPLAPDPMTVEELWDSGLTDEGSRLWGAARVGGWTVIQEHGGYIGTTGTLVRLSRGTEAVAVDMPMTGRYKFIYCRDGETVVDFDPLNPSKRLGSEPDRLVAHMRQVGLDPTADALYGNLDLMALELADHVTGIHLDPEVLGGPFLWGETRNDRPSVPAPPDQVLRHRDPELAAAIDQATAAGRARAVARFLRYLALDADAADEPAIAGFLETIERQDASGMERHRPGLERLFGAWRAESAELPALHMIDRRRDLEVFARIQKSSLRGLLVRAVEAALHPDPLLAAFGALDEVNRFAGPVGAQRHQDVMALLRDG